MRARTILAALACLACAPAAAQRMGLDQYQHTAWTVRDGAPGGVRQFAQGADGVLWIASDMGLFHFDGVRFERFEPPAGQALPAVRFLLALPDTSLWVAHRVSGASLLHRGRIVTYGAKEGLPDAPVTAFARDSGGTMWAATAAGLSRFDGRRWKEMGPEEGFPGGLTMPVLVDRRGTVWAGTVEGFYFLPRGARRFQKRDVIVAGESKTGYLALGPDGSVWATVPVTGLFLVADTSGRPPPPGTPASPFPGLGALYAVHPNRPAVGFGQMAGRLLQVWLPGTPGIPPAPAGRAVSAEIPFSRAAGMSGDLVTTALYDREGTLWVGTSSGVDRFRQTRLTPVVWPGTVQWPAVAPDSGGRMWAGAQLGTPVGLFSVGERVVPRPEFTHELLSLRRDLHGGLLLGGDSVWERRGNAFVLVPLPPPSNLAGDGHTVYAVERDRDGRLWVSLRPGVLRRGAAGVWERFGVKQGLGMASVITADSSGRTWLGYPDGRVALATGDSVRVLTAADGADVGMVAAITVHGSRVWIAGVSGVAVLDPRAARTRFVPLRTAGEPLRGISGIVETQAGELWMNGLDGVTRIPAAEVRRALREPGYRARYERLDHHDGIEPPAPQNRPLPSAVAGTDGRIWFISARGLSWVDPTQMRRNTMPPPVHLRALSAGGRRYPAGRDTIRLPPRTTPLSVAYTAYSLAVPERVRFRYRLEGLDTAWSDAGSRREAFYTNLPPGRYRFHVIAANEDGVWNTEGASLHFIVAPAWNQTWWFRALAVLALAALPAAAALAWQRRRGRRAAERERARFEAMLAERTRVARELHDTLLGDMAGVAMQLSAGARRAEASGGAGAPVVELLSGLGAQVRRTLVEARRSVTALREAPEEPGPLHERLAGAARRAFAGTGIDVQVEHAGSPRPLAPAVEAEVVAIAAEAMANAREHSGARTVAVACAYEHGALRVRVRDDGRGFDPSGGAPEGHWGLVGMRERAAAIGATLEVTSAPGAGTEVALAVPAAEGRPRWRERLVRPGRG